MHRNTCSRISADGTGNRILKSVGNIESITTMLFTYNDGGRAAAGFEGKAGDCVTRSIAIATGKPYSEVYDALFESSRDYGDTHRGRVAKRIRERGGSPRQGQFRVVYQTYLESLGWKWIPTMKIGSGCKVHLNAEELPKGRLLVKVSKHLTAVIDGVVHDTHDCSRDGKRCVYGYFVKE